MSGGLDLASLGVDIDTTDLGVGIVRFQDLVRASQVLETAISSLESSARSGVSSLTGYGDAAGRAATGIDKVSAAARGVGAGMDTAAAAVRRAVGIYDNLVASIDGASRALGGLTSLRTSGNQSLAEEVTRLGAVAAAHNEVAASADRAAAAESRRAAASRTSPGGGGGGGGSGGGGSLPPPPSAPPPTGGGGGGGGPVAPGVGPSPSSLAQIQRVVESYITKIGQTSRSGQDLEEYTAVRKVGADPADLTSEQQGLKEIAGLYYELATAAKAAEAAEKARSTQAGRAFQEQLNESLGITRPAGAPDNRSARDSAAVFREAAEAQEKIEGLQRSQSGGQFAQDLDAQFNNFQKVAGSARDAARAFEEFFAAQDKTDQLRRANIGQQFAQGVNDQYNNFQPRAQSARESGSVFEEDWRRVQQINAQDSQRFGQRVNESFNNFQGSGGGSARDSARVFEEEAKRVAAAEKEAAAAAAAYGRDLEGLKSKLDPTRNALSAFYKEMGLAQEAFTRGDINGGQRDTLIAMAETSYKKATAAMDEHGKKVGLSGQQYFWLASNVKDFFNQVVAGGSLVTASLQQFPMMAQILGMANGGVGGAVTGIRRDAATLLKGAAGFGGPTPQTSPGADGAEAVGEIAAAEITRRMAQSSAIPSAAPAGARVAAEGLGAVEAGLTGVVRVSALAVGALAGIATALLGLYALGNSRREALERSTFGTGRRTGMTSGQLEDQSLAGADASIGISRATSREAVAAMAATGNLSASSMSAAQKVLKDYAYTTGQEMVPAAKELAEALDGSSSGVDKLNAKTGFLSATTREAYNTMVASGDKVGAQKLLIDALSTSLESASAKAGLFSRTWNLLRTGIANALDIAATGVDKVVTGGTLEEQLAKARADVEALKKRGVTEEPSATDIVFGNGGASQELVNANKRVEELEKKTKDVAEGFKNAAQAAKSIKLDDTIKGMNPLNEQIKEVKTRLDLLNSYKLSLDLPVSQMKELDLATASTARQLRQMAEDAKSGGAAFADMVRNAQEGLRTVGFTDFAQKMSASQKKVEDDIRDLARRNENSVVVDTAKLEEARAKINNSDDSPTEKIRQIQKLETDADNYRRQEAAIRERGRLEQSTTSAESTLRLNQSGGSYSRAPDNVKQLIDAAAAARGTVPKELLAGIVETESSFKPDKFGYDPVKKKYTSAYGYTQVMTAAEQDIRKLPGMSGFDRMDPNQNINGGAAYLEKMIAAFGGDRFKGVAAYHDGETATRNALERTGQVLPAGAEYARIVAKKGGFSYEGGPQSAAGVDARQDDVARGLRERAKTIQIEAANPNSQYQQDYQTEYLKRYNSEMQTMGTVSEAAKSEIEKAARAVAQLNQEAGKTRLGKDMAFELEQMGRTPEDAAAYARVRGAGVDVNTDMGQALLKQAQYNTSMQQAKGIAQDTWGSISQGILSGASAAEIATSALNKLASKLMDMAGNELIAGLFGGGGKSPDANGGGLGGLFKGLTGGGSNGGLSGFFGGGGGSGGLLGSLFSSGNNFSGQAAGAIGPFQPASGGGFFDAIKGFFGFANGGIMTGRGPVPLRPYAAGGVATGPQMALFGEASQNEAYIPLPDGRTVPVTLDRAGEGSAVGSSAPSFVASITMQGSSGDPRADKDHADNTARTMESTFKQMFDKHVAQESRPGGSMYRSGARREN